MQYAQWGQPCSTSRPTSPRPSTPWYWRSCLPEQTSNSLIAFLIDLWNATVQALSDGRSGPSIQGSLYDPRAYDALPIPGPAAGDHQLASEWGASMSELTTRRQTDLALSKQLDGRRSVRICNDQCCYNGTECVDYSQLVVRLFCTLVSS
jgi:hypothetical protein